MARADVLRQLGDWSAAAQQYEVVVRLCEEGHLVGVYRFQPQLQLGRALRMLERHADAEAALQAAAAALPATIGYAKDSLCAEFVQLYEKWGKPEELARWRQEQQCAKAGDG